MNFTFIKILIFLLGSSYQLSNNFYQRGWFGRFQKMPVLPNFKEDIHLVAITLSYKNEKE